MLKLNVYVVMIVLFALCWWTCSSSKELFNADAANSVTKWTFPVNGVERREFADRVKLTDGIAFVPPTDIPVNNLNFPEFAKQIQLLGVQYVICRAEDKVQVMRTIMTKLNTWAVNKVPINEDNLYYVIGILLTLSKVQTDPLMPPVLVELMNVYGWLMDNVKNKPISSTHVACVAILLGIMSNNRTMIQNAMISWKNIFANVIPNLMNDLNSAQKFVDVAYVLNDATLFLYLMYINNVNVLDDSELNTYHRVVNQYAAVTLQNHDYLTMLYGDKNPAHTLAWIVLYNRMFRWTRVEKENLQFFTDNLATMLSFRDTGYGGSSFWNFSI